MIAIHRFSDNPSAEFRALQIWQILVCAAENRQTLTYKILAGRMGYKGAGVLANTLGHVLYYCKLNGLPPLTAIVVNEKTGLPGDGIGIPVERILSDHEKVFSFNWFDLLPPSPDDLKEAVTKGRLES
jgi:hypothetical protein